MYVLKCNGQYQKEGIRNTCSTEKYIFESDIVHSGIYAKSPYYKRANLWNDIPMNLQKLPDKCKFKNGIKKHFNAY